MILIDISCIFRPMTYVAWKSSVRGDSSSDLIDDDEYSFDEILSLDIRSRMLTSLLDIKDTYAKPGEEIVIAVDSKMNWRKFIFPEYKHKRKEKRDEDEIDWTLCFNIFNEFIDDLKENFQFKVIRWEVPDKNIGCEADDIIGVLAKYKEGLERIIIIANDIDFFQLHDIEDLEQYNYDHTRKDKVHACKSLKIDVDYDITPEEFILLKTLCGDRKDGVPNCLNEDDVWVDESKKYKSLGPKTCIKIIDGDEKMVNKHGSIDDLSGTEFFQRNQSMLDMNFLPDKIRDAILNAYLSYEYKGSLAKIQNYFKTKCLVGSNHLYKASRRFLVEGVTSEPGGRQNPFRRFLN